MDNLYSRFLEQNPAGGLHHISFFVKDLDKWIDDHSSVDEFVAFYIYAGVKNHSLWSYYLSGIINSAIETLGNYYLDKQCNINQMKKILKESHKLEIINENPLELKSIK